MLKNMMAVLFVFSLLGLTAGCEATLKGMGEDIEQMGKSIQDTVGSGKDDNKDSDKDADAKK